MTRPLAKRVLLIEDNPGDARLLREMVQEQDSFDTELMHVDCMKDAETHLAERSADIVLLDLGLPDAQGLAAIRRARAAAPAASLVVLTGLDDHLLSEQALREGAQDYLIKGQIETPGLVRAFRYAIERKRLEKLKDEFVATVSHELRTPLTSISGSLGLLMGKTASSIADPARLIAIAHTNSLRLIRLINDILDIEKMSQGRIFFSFQRIDVRTLVELAIEANTGFAEDHGVRIRLSDGEAGAYMRADPDRLTQVVTNLLSNAIKFSPADNEVVVAVEKRPDVVRISVRDHGPGIPPDFRSQIFTKFAQADGSSGRERGGSGLGLSIVKQIVDRLGGEVGFTDADGGGTTFHTEFLSWEATARMAIDPDAHPDALRILLCEDDIDTAVATRQQLRQVGFGTDFAYTAAEAMTAAAAVHYRAILVDLQLPDSDGISLIARLRDIPRYSETPVIVVSADPSRGRDDLRASKLNVLGWLNKPADLERLMGMLTMPTELQQN